MGGKSFNFNNDPEKLNIISHNVGFGVLINLSKGRYQEGMSDPASAQKILELENRMNMYSEKIDELEVQAQRVDELEEEVAAKDAEMKMIKTTIARALFEFDGKELRVTQREGIVYVTLDNDMLFEPGSWIVAKEGVKAVEALGRVLALNPDVSILIEGHTDNRPYKGGGNIKDNWDLSIKRATAIVEILRKNPNINSKNLTAAGKGEHAPIASNETVEGRAKNRRIEVIITPDLEEVSKILKD
jgi:chemotaxis protein MotB